MSRNVLRICGIVAGILLTLFAAVRTSDATTLTIQTNSDTTVWANSPTNNFGNWQAATVGRQVSKSATLRSFFYFDLSTLPSDAIINAATLRVYIDQTSADPLGLGVTAARLDASFIEGDGTSGVTWNTQPGILSSPTTTATMNTTAGSWFEMGMQTLVVAVRAQWQSRRLLASRGRHR